MTPDPTLLDPTGEPVDAPGIEHPTVSEQAAVVEAAAEVRPPAAELGNVVVLVGFIAAMVVLGFGVSWWIPGLIAGLLGVLFLHELGHYVTARISGMKVTEFFLGFGPRIWSFRRGETEYGLKAIPAGAYVRIIGMTNLDEIHPLDEDRTYRAQPYWQRMMTILAGSAMHFVMAIVALVVLFGAYGYPGFYGPPWEVDRVVSGSSADSMGVERGDRIVSFQGETFNTWQDFGDLVQQTPIGPIEVEVDRDGETLVLEGDLGARSGDIVGAGFGLLLEELPANAGIAVDTLRNGSSADEFGFVAGDVIVSADGVENPSQIELAEILQRFDGSGLELVVARGETDAAASREELVGTVTLDRREPFRGFFGVGADWLEVEQPTWLTSIGLAFEDFGAIAATNLAGLADLVNPLNLFDGEDTAAPTAGASGPPPLAPPEDGGNRPVSVIGVFRLMAESEQTSEVLFMFVMVNVFIGLFNLAPVLPLDGGHAALATYERARQLWTLDPTYRVDASRLVPFVWAVVVLLVAFGLWAALLDIFSWPA